MGSGFTAGGHKLPGDRGFFGVPQVDALLKTGGFPALACVLRSFRRSFVLPCPLPLGLEEVWTFLEFAAKGIFERAINSCAEKRLLRSKIKKPESRSDDEHVQCRMARDDHTQPRLRDIDFLMLTGWDVRRILTRVYRELVPPEANEPYASLFRKLELGDTSASKAASTTFISLNYDTVLENALHQANVRWHYKHVPTNVPRNPVGVGVLKPHGSLNWRFEGNDPPVNISTDYSLEPVICRSHSDNRFVQAMIVPPTQTKQVIAIGETQTSESRQLFSGIWGEAVDALAAASRVVVIGYSFPTTDLHLQTMFHLALRKRRYSRYDHVSCCTVADGREGLVFARAARYLPATNDHFNPNGYDGLVAQGLA